MANSTNLADLRVSVRRRIDHENSGYVSDDELDDYINDTGSELYDLIAQAHKLHFREVDTFATVAGQHEYDLPTDYYRTLAIFAQQGGVRYSQLEPLMLREMPDRWWYDSGLVTGEDHYLRYLITKDALVFEPSPQGAVTLEHWYVPAYTKLVEDTDTLPFAVVNGWDIVIKLGAAIAVRIKENQPIADLMALKQAAEARIVKAAAKRDEGHPQRIVDVRHGRGSGRRRRA